MKSKLIRGIVPPLVTPLLGRDQLDVGGLERLVEHVLGGGASGLFLLGTTGEGPSLSPRLRRETVQVACRANGGRVPILVGITDTSLEEALSLACFASEAGATAVVAAPPPYFPLGQAELQEYFEVLSDELPLPLMLYNMPAMTKISFSAAVVERLSERENIIGIKDSAGDLDGFVHLLRAAQARPDWSVMMGSETLLAAAVAAGGDGGVCGGANFAPALYVALYEAARAGESDQVRELQAQVLALGERLYTHGAHPSSAIKGIKGALRCLGICADYMAPPLHAFGDAERARLRAALEEIQIGLPA